MVWVCRKRERGSCGLGKERGMVPSQKQVEHGSGILLNVPGCSLFHCCRTMAYVNEYCLTDDVNSVHVHNTHTHTHTHTHTQVPLATLK